MTTTKTVKAGRLENPRGLKNFKKLNWDTVEVGTAFNDETGKVFKVVDLGSREFNPFKVRWVSYTDRPGTDPKGKTMLRPLWA